MMGAMKILLLTLVFTGIAAAQSAPAPIEAPKPPDAVIAAYFKADAALGAARGQHEAMMEDVKKKIAESVARQIQLTVNALVAQSQLQQSCGAYQLDQQALQAGEVKCVEKPKK